MPKQVEQKNIFPQPIKIARRRGRFISLSDTFMSVSQRLRSQKLVEKRDEAILKGGRELNNQEVKYANHTKNIHKANSQIINIHRIR